MPRKRAYLETGLDPSFLQIDSIHDNALLQKVRNMWEFASLMQYIHFFGHIVKIDENLEVDDLERACVQPEDAHKLEEVGLALLKYVSSHRGLTRELFDEYTRRQYTAKAPQRNPFGEEEEPNKFANFDIRTKLRVLHQLSLWTLSNAERIRGLSVETDAEQALWRIEPLGWDSDDNIYYVLDDNRLYRRVEPPIPEPISKSKAKSKAKAKPRSKALRASKRRKLSDAGDESQDNTHVDIDDTVEIPPEDTAEDGDELFGSWSCVAVTLEQYQAFIESIRKSKDPNEKVLCKSIIDNVLPELERRAEAQRQKALKKQREFEAEQRMLTAKRSSRIATRVDKQKEAEEAAAAEKKRRDELRMAHMEEERQRRQEEQRESRMMTREQRLKDREVKRILHEEELARIEELQRNGLDEADSRRSERQLQTEMERRQQELDRLREEEEQWTFDCAVCGLFGQNLDDGLDSVECERCQTWQHSACYGLQPHDAQREDFHFVCTDCKRKAEFDSKPKLPPLKLKRPSQSPQQNQNGFDGAVSEQHQEPQHQAANVVETNTPAQPVSHSPGLPKGNLSNGPSLSPKGQSQGPPGYHPDTKPEVGRPQSAWDGQPLPPPPRPDRSAEVPDGRMQPVANGMPPPQQLHALAHASAVSTSDVPHEHPSPNVAASRVETATAQQPVRAPSSSPQMRPVQTPTAPVSSPIKSRPVESIEPVYQGLPRAQSQSLMALSGSPGPVFSPKNQDYDALMAGQSPVKQPSSSPQPPPSQHRPVFSPTAPLTAMTPATNGRQISATPTNSVLRASTHMTSSPIPPLGNGQVIPQKQDTPRQPPPDSIGDTPIVPPSLALSPTAIDGGKGMSVETGIGGLGQGNVPVKKSPIESVVAGDVLMHDAA